MSSKTGRGWKIEHVKESRREIDQAERLFYFSDPANDPGTRSSNGTRISSSCKAERGMESPTMVKKFFAVISSHGECALVPQIQIRKSSWRDVRFADQPSGRRDHRELRPTRFWVFSRRKLTSSLAQKEFRRRASAESSPGISYAASCFRVIRRVRIHQMNPQNRMARPNSAAAMPLRTRSSRQRREIFSSCPAIQCS